MTAPSMPSPSRVVGNSLTLLRKKGYSPQEARKIVADVIEAVGKSQSDFEPWAVEWLRGMWHAAMGTTRRPDGQAASDGGTAAAPERQ